MTAVARPFRRPLAALAVVASALLASIGPGAVRAADAPRAKPPHIVFVLADDLGCGDLGCYNQDSKIPTPNLDRLAAQGMRFTDAHSPSSVCTPTRYAVVTGRYAWRGKLQKGVLQGYDPLLIEEGRTTVASLLKGHGYRTACIGKWHLGLGSQKPTDYAKPLAPGPRSVGFDSFFGIPASLDMPPYVFVRNEAPVEAPTATIGDSAMRRYGGGGFWRGGPIGPSFKHENVLPELQREAVAVVESHAKEHPDRPLFLYLPLASPHTPWMPTKEWQGKSRAGWYGDFVMHTDSAVGAVMAALDRTGMAGSTLFFATSDNGAHWLPADVARFDHEANNRRRGQKADAWEGGHRVPFLARWPGRIAPGSTSDETICLVDLLATCAALVGAELPADAGEDSYDLTPVLLGKPRTGPLREATVHHAADGTFCIRQGSWKLITALGSRGFSQPKTEPVVDGGPKGQLYDLAADPRETRNVWLRHPEVVARLESLLRTYRDSGRSTNRK